MQRELQRAFETRSLVKTGNSYTTDSKKYDEYNKKFLAQKHEEYEYNGKRYVRIKANSYFDGNEFTLSNGEKYKDGDDVWVEVSPVKWIVDEKAKIMITDKLIFSGVQFNHTQNYQTEHFDQTDIKTFMDTYLAKDLVQTRGTVSLGEKTENTQSIFYIADEVYERSKNSDKKVVIMLDELLNVKPAVQSLVYTLVLNRMVEIGKGLKLPDNVVVVATGNQKKYSSVAEDLAEPLEKRFDHILDMEPKVGEWITEYAIPKKIHPAVIGYMLSKYNSSGKSDNIKDIGYFYEEPERGT